MILQKVFLEIGSVKGTLKIPVLPNFRSGDNRWTNFAPVNNATFQYVLQLAECGGIICVKFGNAKFAEQGFLTTKKS